MNTASYPSVNSSEQKDLLRSDAKSEYARMKRQWPCAFEQLLSKRGLNTEEQRVRFLCPCLEDLHDPYSLKDMDLAVERIMNAQRDGEEILIYGDYDADGITSTALLKQYLDGLGMRVHTYIPDRLTEGYGLSCAVIDAFIEKNVRLIVTVDTGSTACSEIAYAKQKGIDTVVTDHHECVGELPQCAAVVNPMRPDCPYPFKGLAGVGVAFKLVCALEMRLFGRENQISAEHMLSFYGDLVALGTVADVMPMLDENRYIVRRGLATLEEGRNTGLAALCGKIGVTGKKGSSSLLGFSIAPHVNAAGRMGDADCALELMLCRKPAEAGALAGRLCAYNQQRKKEEQIIFEQAEKMILAQGCGQDDVLVLFADGWHPGVLGIVAARITEKYKKTSVLISLEGDEGKGSCRSVPGMDLVALLSKAEDYIVKFGGHELAAGLTVKRDQIPFLQKKILMEAQKMASASHGETGEKTPDMTVSALDLSLPFAKALEMLEPFGEGNPTPLFLLQGAQIESVMPLSLGKHTKLLVKKKELTFTALLFSQKTALFPFTEGDFVDLVFELGVNEYMKKKSVQLLVRSVLPAKTTLIEFSKNREAVSALTCGAPFAVPFPCREDFARVYTALRMLEKAGEHVFCLRILALKAGCASLAQCLLILLVFEEQKLMWLWRMTENDDCYRFGLLPAEKKADLEHSDLLMRYS